MSTQLVEAPVAPEPSLSAGVCGLLQVLARGAKPDGSLHLRADAGVVFGLATAGNVPVAEVSAKWIPSFALRCLEERAALPWRVSLAAMRGRASVDPQSLSAVACSWSIERVYRNPRKPDSPYGKEWGWPEDRVAEIMAGIEAFSAPPTMIVLGLPSVVAVWALDEPMPAAGPVDQAKVMLLMRALAARVGADIPADDMRLTDVSIPLPGVACANQGRDVVVVPAFHPERVYSAQDIETAIAAKKGKNS